MTEEIRAPRRPVTPPQRVVTALLDRRWVSLFTELSLIVTGILIALAIDGWVRDSKDRETETTYLELLRDDLALIEAELAQFVKFEKSMLSTGKAFLDAISTADPSNGDRPLHGMLGELSIRRTLRLDSAVYTDLTSTGNIQLIANQELRRQVVRYFADTERSELIVEKNSKEYVDEIFVRFLMDSGVAFGADRSTLAPVLNANTVLMNTLGPDFSWPRNDVLRKPPRASAWDDFRQQVLFRMRIAASGQVMGERLSETTRQLRSSIEEELERRDTG